VKQSQLSKEVKEAQVQRKTATDEFTDLNEKYVGIIFHLYTNLSG